MLAAPPEFLVAFLYDYLFIVKHLNRYHMKNSYSYQYGNNNHSKIAYDYSRIRFYEGICVILRCTKVLKNTGPEQRQKKQEPPTQQQINWQHTSKPHLYLFKIRPKSH